MTTTSKKRGDAMPPLKCCPQCYMCLVSSVRHCHECGHDFRDPRTAWESHDSKRRSIIYRGVYYVAFRPDRSSRWTIRDASTLVDIEQNLSTREVTSYFKLQEAVEMTAEKALYCL